MPQRRRKWAQVNLENLYQDQTYFIIYNVTLDPLVPDNHTVYRFLLLIYFAHRWLHKRSATEEAISRPMCLQLMCPFLEVLGKKSNAIDIDVIIVIIDINSNDNDNKESPKFKEKATRLS